MDCQSRSDPLFCPFPIGEEFVFFPIMFSLRSFIFLLCLHALAASVEAAEWRVLHAEQGAKVSSQVPQKDSTTFNLHLPDGKAALVLGSAVNFSLVIDDLTPTLRLKSDQFSDGILHAAYTESAA